MGEPIVPTSGHVLHFEWQGDEWFLASVQGMRPSPWQTEATEEAMSLSVTEGQSIRCQVRDQLAR
ncbi:MAG TPA: hypothetical protein VHQ03_01310 [Candidatus Dormibacteraeota bacterium]|nr:hypothetical protein [Candidatus Dormibacteraeota bacterium]